MLKKKQKEETPKKTEDNGNNDIGELLKTVLKNQEEIAERLNYMEKHRTDPSAEAHLKMVNFTYDTDDKHLPELTRIPINAARPYALCMGLESIFDEDVQQGLVPLSAKVRNYYFRLMRSVGGVHLGRGVRLAEEQAQSEAEEAEEMEMGGDE